MTNLTHFRKFKSLNFFNRIFKISNILAANLKQTFTYTMYKLNKGLYCWTITIIPDSEVFSQNVGGACFKERCNVSSTGADKKSNFLMFLSASIYGQSLIEIVDTKQKNIIMHVSSRLVSSVALLYSISSDKFDVIFLSSSRKKVFNIKHLIYVYIIFIEQRDQIFPKQQLFSTHGNLMHSGNLL